MARSYNTPNVVFPLYFNVDTEAPLDNRLVVDTKNDLWNGTLQPCYTGMVVYVKGTPTNKLSSLWVLIDNDYRDKNSWREIKSVDNYVVETIGKLSSIESPYIGMTVYVNETQTLWTLISKDNWKEIKSGGAYFVEKITDLSNPDLRPYVGMLVHVHENPTSVYMYNGDNVWKEFSSIDSYVVETRDDLDKIKSPYVGMFVHVKTEPHCMYLYSYKTTDTGEIEKDTNGNFVYTWKVFKDYDTVLGNVDLSDIQNQIDKLKEEIENLKSPNLHVDLHNINGEDLLRFRYDKSIKKSDTFTFDGINHKLTFTTPEQNETK